MDKNIKYHISYVILFILSLSPYRIHADDGTKIELMLDKISSYEYGMSRQPLSEFSDFVRTALNTEEGTALLESKSLMFLKSSATNEAKQFICRQLSLYGTGRSVETLVDLLKNGETAEMALFTLARIPGDGVNSALIGILHEYSQSDAELETNLKTGLINTLGARKAAAAVAVIAGYTGSSNDKVSAAAVSALGEIGTKEAAEVLTLLLNTGSEVLRDNIFDSLLICTDALASDNSVEAVKIYREVLILNAPVQVKQAAVIGLIKSASDKRADFITLFLLGEDELLQQAAVPFIRQLDNSGDLRKIASLLPKVSENIKIQMLGALEDPGKKAVHAFVIKAFESNSPEIKAAAIKVLMYIGSSADVELIAGAAAGNNDMLEETALLCLELLNEKGVDDEIGRLLPRYDSEMQIKLIEILGNRKAYTAYKEVYKISKSEDRKVRAEAYNTLGLIAKPDNLEDLIGLLYETDSDAERRKIESAIAKVVRKIQEKQNRAGLLINELIESDDTGIKVSILRILGTTGSQKAYPYLLDALTSDDESLIKTALHGLSAWPGAEAAEDLIKFAAGTKNETFAVLALRAAVKVLKENEDIDHSIKLQLYKTAIDLTLSENEKRLVLSGLAGVKSVQAMLFSAEFLVNEKLRPEAETAVLSIAAVVGRQAPEKTKNCMKKILEKTSDDEIKKRVEDILSYLEQ